MSTNDSQYWPESGTILFVTEHEKQDTKEVWDFVRHLFVKDEARNGVLFDAGSHPDFHVVQPVEEAKHIKIDQIREMIEWSVGLPLIAKRKIAIITPADALNVQSANALLKTLEEAPAYMLFILITHRPSALPATVRSRCRIIQLFGGHSDEVNAELRSLIIKDLQDLQNDVAEPVALAAKWLKLDVKALMYTLLLVLHEEARQRALSKKVIRSEHWWSFVDKVFEARRAVEDKMNLNTQLMLETLLIQYTALFSIDANIQALKFKDYS